MPDIYVVPFIMSVLFCAALAGAFAVVGLTYLMG
jgi:hypothetical protein